MTAPLRFHDPGWSRDHFIDVILVRCPKCSGIAHVVPASPRRDTTRPSPHARRNLICHACGLSRRTTDSTLRFHWGSATDPYFQAPLWLRAKTRHGPLWAYNREHLELIRQFVASSLRERDAWYEQGRKMTLIARLPVWVKRAKNRAEVLRAIERLQRLPTGPTLL
ncbi:hypothetical protein I5Q34_19415 [Streptomyces sp. AV19]|uniref:hypothetical protein n=1 Tax=Streptomyces sp. AV19 TaxID=2793068 RepID=UPI0018FE4FCB|nr:hypothetical protein [Streptomyces sp. AV19]MBH1936417.1 hypothetical protein [Streptomyces sp. AV19]MDG4532466.1 hypothetical protein [Streptomyces sp. AV19]